AVALDVVAVAAASVVALRLRAARVPKPPLVAVLPFESEGPAPDTTFADGLTDAVAGKLARLSALRVIDRGSVVAARVARQTPAQWGRVLDADYVLRATIRWARGADGRPRAQV